MTPLLLQQLFFMAQRVSSKIHNNNIISHNNVLLDPTVGVISSISCILFVIMCAVILTTFIMKKTKLDSVRYVTIS